MKPGDIIEWVYPKNGNVVVDHNEKLWSSTMKKWVPIGGTHLLVSVADDIMTWLPVCRNNGLFRAHVDDAVPLSTHGGEEIVVPRVALEITPKM